MKVKNILIVFGTRPEAIKLAPLIKLFQEDSNFRIKICVTGQHREMLDQVLSLFNIIPDFDLNVMKKSQSLFDITIEVMSGLKNIIRADNFNYMVVHGDTTTSTSAALSAFYEKLPVLHVEAGLRTKNIYSPYPEEMNRQLTSRLAKYHFAPTKKSKLNLMNEGIEEKNILITGNTVIDSLFLILEKIRKNGELKNIIKSELIKSGFNLNIKKKIILVTGHRRENFGVGFENICKALKKIANSNPDVDIVYPVHLNPNVQEIVHNTLGKENNIFLCNPFDYLPFVYLMKASFLFITDSGGIQEEAPSLGKPVVLLRKDTERPEGVLIGTVKLAGSDTNKIVELTQLLLDDKNEYKKMCNLKNPYGDGNASQKILKYIKTI